MSLVSFTANGPKCVKGEAQPYSVTCVPPLKCPLRPTSPFLQMELFVTSHIFVLPYGRFPANSLSADEITSERERLKEIYALIVSFIICDTLCLGICQCCHINR